MVRRVLHVLGIALVSVASVVVYGASAGADQPVPSCTVDYSGSYQYATADEGVLAEPDVTAVSCTGVSAPVVQGLYFVDGHLYSFEVLTDGYQTGADYTTPLPSSFSYTVDPTVDSGGDVDNGTYLGQGLQSFNDEYLSYLPSLPDGATSDVIETDSVETSFPVGTVAANGEDAPSGGGGGSGGGSGGSVGGSSSSDPVTLAFASTGGSLVTDLGLGAAVVVSLAAVGYGIWMFRKWSKRAVSAA
jgi:hypothetical protein